MPASKASRLTGLERYRVYKRIETGRRWSSLQQIGTILGFFVPART